MPAGWPRRLAVVTITIGLMMSVLSNSMTNLALPYIAQDLNITAESSIWIVNATPDRPDHLAAARGGVGRHRGLSPRLPLRPGPVLAGLARLRAGAVAALAAGGPHLPGPGRCRHHVGPARPGARHLPAFPARPRPRLQHHRGRHLAGRRSLDRRPRPVDGPLAVPVRRLRTAWPHLLRPGRTLPAAHHAYPSAVRRDLGGAVGRHLRIADLRHRRPRSRPSSRGDRL